MSDSLKIGIYEDLLTHALKEKIEHLSSNSLQPDIKPADENLISDYITRTLTAHLKKALSTLSSKGKHPEKQHELANKIIKLIASHHEDLNYLNEEEFLETTNNLLTEIKEHDSLSFERPTTSLISPSLFTGSGGSPQLGKELELEFASADRVDMLVSFIKSAGVNLIYPSLKKFTERGGKLRIITTTYLGASDPVAIHKLKQLPNTEVKVSYDTKHSRLHAKAYFIHRNSGHSCSYIGSANLSHAAMTSGLEWTVKLPLLELPSLFRRCEAQFETYWESDSFKNYEEDDFDYLVKSTSAEKYFRSDPTRLTIFELKPYEHQQIVLDEINEARSERKQFRNLVVAATGTGKTMIAAFDYKRLCSPKNKPKLLFIAHRKEILRQARDSFRHVLGDGNFGEELYDGKNPENHEHLFCSISSFNARDLINKFGENYWDIVILDEAHHGKANSYRIILNGLKPSVLLGLTATPERTDGSSIAEDFDSPIASEIRLPEALQQKLLCPFHYYAISDSTVDFSRVSWKQGRYDRTELGNVISGNRARIDLILKKIIEYFPAPLDPKDFDRENLRAIGFCVSQSHAREMADTFKKAGIEARSLDSNSTPEYRVDTRRMLEEGSLNFIFTVDLFNEGIDIPVVNGILFLRPTESHVVFQQQLGRGLRSHDDKEQLIVLDFVGAVNKKFRFDLRFKSLLPGKRHDLKKEIEHGFPHLPAGCYIHFEKTAREIILKNIRQTYLNIETRIVDSFSNYTKAPSFAEYIKDTEESPIELLTKRTWSDWKDLGKFKTASNLNEKPPEINSLARVSLVNDPSYLKFLSDLLTVPDSQLGHYLESQLYTASAYYLLWNKAGKDLFFSSYLEAFTAIRDNKRYSADLDEVIAYSKQNQLPQLPEKYNPNSKLRLHANYTMRDITAFYEKASIETSGPTGTGVVSIKEKKIYIHFITFEKTEKLFSETTMYRDYLSSRDILHWESQSSATQDSPTGRNYIQQKELGYQVHTFARIRKLEGKLTSPFVYLGEADFISAEGNRPISIVWKLRTPVTHQFFNEAKLAAGIS